MIKISFKDTDMKRVRSAIQRTMLAVKSAQANLAYIGAVDYRNALMDAIANQSMPSRAYYPPYNQGYAKWKLETAGHLRFWELRGDLIANLRVFKAAGNWVSGLLPGATSSMGENISEYAYRNETDRGRPLFGPVAKQYARTGWKQRGKEALNAISREWR